MKNKLNVTISGMQMTVNTDYDQAQVNLLADDISEKMEALLKTSRYYSKLDAALLLLLDLTDRNRRLEAESAAMKKKVETMALDLEIQRIENEKLAGKETGANA